MPDQYDDELARMLAQYGEPPRNSRAALSAYTPTMPERVRDAGNDLARWADGWLPRDLGNRTIDMWRMMPTGLAYSGGESLGRGDYATGASKVGLAALAPVLGRALMTPSPMAAPREPFSLVQSRRPDIRELSYMPNLRERFNAAGSAHDAALAMLPSRGIWEQPVSALIMQGQKPAGFVNWHRSGDGGKSAYIDYMQTRPHIEMQAGDVLDLLRQFRATSPGIDRVEGMRISGAHGRNPGANPKQVLEWAR